MDTNAIDYGKMVMKNLHLSGVGVAKNYLLTRVRMSDHKDHPYVKIAFSSCN